jgi:hypothetical protein
VEETVKLVYGGKVDFEDEAIVACDAVAFDDFGDASSKFGDLR